MPKLINLFLIAILILSGLQVEAQRDRYSIDKPLKSRRVGVRFIIKQKVTAYKTYRQEIKLLKAEQKASQKLIKQHLSIQDKKTLRMMKESRKISKRINKFGTALPPHKRIYYKLKRKFK